MFMVMVKNENLISLWRGNVKLKTIKITRRDIIMIIIQFFHEMTSHLWCQKVLNEYWDTRQSRILMGDEDDVSWCLSWQSGSLSSPIDNNYSFSCFLPMSHGHREMWSSSYRFWLKVSSSSGWHLWWSKSHPGFRWFRHHNCWWEIRLLGMRDDDHLRTTQSINRWESEMLPEPQHQCVVMQSKKEFSFPLPSVRLFGSVHLFSSIYWSDGKRIKEKEWWKWGYDADSKIGAE